MKCRMLEKKSSTVTWSKIGTTVWSKYCLVGSPLTSDLLIKRSINKEVFKANNDEKLIRNQNNEDN